jgi:hypothetical protein
MGSAIDWQSEVVLKLGTEDIVLLNPRRPDWDASWIQRMSNPEFRNQVEWELDAMHFADIIMMYFDPNTKSPITLLELGLYAPEEKLIVGCPDGYWRKGNVEVVCSRYRVPLHHNLDDLIKGTRSVLEKVRGAETYEKD